MSESIEVSDDDIITKAGQEDIIKILDCTEALTGCFDIGVGLIVCSYVSQNSSIIKGYGFRKGYCYICTRNSFYRYDA